MDNQIIIPIKINEVFSQQAFSFDFEDYYSKKVIDKLSKAKYSDDSEKKYLVLHNYDAFRVDKFSTDIFIYRKYGNLIFDKLKEKVKFYDSNRFYNDIFFMDFSTFNEKFNITKID